MLFHMYGFFCNDDTTKAARIVVSSLQKNPDIWNNTKKLKLTIKMRVIKNGNTGAARELISIAQGICMVQH